MQRLLEPEVMEAAEEARDLDRMMRLYALFKDRPYIKEIAQLIRERESSISILDVGCGTGWITLNIANKNPKSKIYALDYSFNMLKLALPRSPGVDFIQGDGKKLPFKDGSFDLILCANMLHHLKNPLDLLSEINRVVKGNGIIVLKDLIRPRFKFVVSLLVGIFGLPLSKILRKEYRDSHYAAFTIEEFKAILKQSGDKIGKIFKNFPYNVNIIYYPRRAS